MIAPYAGGIGMRGRMQGSGRPLANYSRTGDYSPGRLATPQPPQSFKPEHSFMRKGTSPTGSAYINDSTFEDDTRKISMIRSVDQLVINTSKALEVLYGDLAIIKRESFLCHPADPSIAHYTLVLHRLSCIDRKTFDSKFYELDQISRNTNHPNILRIFSFWSEDSPDAFSYKSLIVLQEYTPFTLRDYISQYLTVHNLDTVPESMLVRIGCDISSALETLHQSNVSHCGLREYSIYVRVDDSLFVGSDLELPEPSMITFCVSLPWRAEMDVLCTPSFDSQTQTRKSTISQMLSTSLVKKAPDTIYIQKEGDLRNNRQKGNAAGSMSGSLGLTSGSRGSSSLAESFSALASLSALGDYFTMDLYSLGIILTKVIETFGPGELKEMEAPTEITTKNIEYAKVLREFYPNLVTSLTLLLNLYEENQDREITVNANNMHSLFGTYFAMIIQRSYRSSLVIRDRKLLVASATVIQCEYRRYLYSKRFKSYRNGVLRANAHSLQAMVKALPNRLYFDKVVNCTIKLESEVKMILLRRRFIQIKNLALLIQKSYRGRTTRRLIKAWRQQLVARRKQMETLGTYITNTDVDTVNVNPFYPEKRTEYDALYPLAFAKYQSVGAYLKAFPDKFSFIENADRDAKILADLSKRNKDLEAENKRMRAELDKVEADAEEKKMAVGMFMDEYLKLERQLKAKYANYNTSCQYSSPIPFTVEPVAYSAWEKLHDTMNVVENVVRNDATVFTRKDAVVKVTFDPSIVTKIKIHPGEPGPLHLRINIMNSDDRELFEDSYELGRNTTEISLAVINAAKATFTFKDNIRGGSICSIRYIEIIGILMPELV